MINGQILWLARFPQPTQSLQLVPGQFGGKAVPAEDPDGKVEAPVGEWPAHLLPVLGEAVGSDEWPVLHYQEDEQ